MEAFTVYIAGKYSNDPALDKFSIKLTMDSLSDAKKLDFKLSNSDKVWLIVNGQAIILDDYLNLLSDEAFNNSDSIWKFLNLVKATNKKEETVHSVKKLFDALSPDEQASLTSDYNAVYSKLSSVLWDASESFYESNPDFYINDDLMMEFIPYIILLGKKRVDTFISKPHLALKLTLKEWEYPFDFYQVFI